jgi:hypothetical protein
MKVGQPRWPLYQPRTQYKPSPARFSPELNSRFLIYIAGELAVMAANAVAIFLEIAFPDTCGMAALALCPFLCYQIHPSYYGFVVISELARETDHPS